MISYKPAHVATKRMQFLMLKFINYTSTLQRCIQF